MQALKGAAAAACSSVCHRQLCFSSVWEKCTYKLNKRNIYFFFLHCMKSSQTTLIGSRFMKNNGVMKLRGVELKSSAGRKAMSHQNRVSVQKRRPLIHPISFTSSAVWRSGLAAGRPRGAQWRRSATCRCSMKLQPPSSVTELSSGLDVVQSSRAATWFGNEWREKVNLTRKRFKQHCKVIVGVGVKRAPTKTETLSRPDKILGLRAHGEGANPHPSFSVKASMHGCGGQGSTLF